MQPADDAAIPDSPLITQGRLKNGLRYIIRPHASPDGQLSLRLLVHAGSLHENDDERGFAHFVEHMAFNGTKNYPAGELVKFLQRQGAQFGPHVNATTSHTSTIYKLDLPARSPDSLETGLRIFRDYADGVLFEASEVKRERGVILGEERTRRTPERNEHEAFVRFLYVHTRIPARAPIGLAGQIASADLADLRRFYDAWYRPENLAVIVVGEISPAVVEKSIQTHFTSLAGRGKPRPAPSRQTMPPLVSPAIAIHPRPFPGSLITFASITDRPDGRPTWDSMLEGLRVKTGVNLLRERLVSFTLTENRIINQAASAQEVDFLHFRRASISVAAAPANIAPALALLEQELRRALETGFTPQEVTRQQAMLRASIRDVSASIQTAPSALLADAYAGYAEDDSPLRLLDELAVPLIEAVDRLTPQNCQSALQKLFAGQPPRIFISCDANYLPSAETVAEAYRASRATALANGSPAEADASFAYEDFGPAGTVLENNYSDDLGVRQLRFSNGVRANLKPTPFEAGQVRFTLRLGHGRLSEPADQPGLALWFPFLWHGGTGKHTAAELSRMLGGLQNITTSTSEDSFVIGGSLPRANLPLAIRQLTAVVADPAFSEDAWASVRSILAGYTSSLWTRPEGPVAQFVLPLLAGGDPRPGIPSDNKTYSYTPGQFRAWFAPQLATGPMEFSLVGDFESDAVIADLAATLGALPPRAERDAHIFPTDLNFLRDRRATRYYFAGTADQASRWEFFWRIQETTTPRDRRLLEMLADIFGDRVRDEVRERKGSTYRVEAGVRWSDAFPGFSFLRCSVDHKPEDREKHTRAVRKLALAIAAKGITADELVRAKAQALAAQTRARTDNEYWLDQVLADSQQRPFRLDAMRSAGSDLNSATVAEINTLAARYFGPDRVFHYLILPSALIPKKKS